MKHITFPLLKGKIIRSCREVGDYQAALIFPYFSATPREEILWNNTVEKQYCEPWNQFCFCMYKHKFGVRTVGIKIKASQQLWELLKGHHNKHWLSSRLTTYLYTIIIFLSCKQYGFLNMCDDNKTTNEWKSRLISQMPGADDVHEVLQPWW